MKKAILFKTAAVLFVAASVFFSCKSDKLDENELSPTQREVEDLMASVGTIPYNREVTDITTSDTIPLNVEGVYYDPELELSQMSTPIKVTTHYSATSNSSEFVLLNPWEGVWPGAIIQGGSLADGVPDAVPIGQKKRQKTNISINMVTGKGNVEYFQESEMSGSAVTQTMNNILAQHIGESTPGDAEYKCERIQSIEELAHHFKLDVKLWKSKLETALGNTFSESKTYMAVELRQTYFTMNVDNIEGVAGAFTKDIKMSDLKNYTGPGNPMCYVASATYGRYYILLFETSESAKSFEKKFRAAFDNINKTDSSIESTTRQVFASTVCKMLQVGGDAAAGLEAAMFNDADKLRKFLVDGAKPTAQSPGALISYKINHLINNQTVRLSNTLSYKVTEQIFKPSTPKRNVLIDIFNVVVDEPVPDPEYTVSYHSTLKINKISAYIIDGNGEYEYRDVPSYKYSAPINIKNSLTIPTYHAVRFDRLTPETRIGIKVEGLLHHQTYHGGTSQETRPFLMLQEYEYDINNNKWAVVENVQLEPFKYISQENKFARMQSNIKLNFRFKCDGDTYPMLAK